MITALKKIYAFSDHWKGVLKKSVVFSLLHSIFDMFQIGALFLILNGLMEGIKGQDILFAFLLLLAGVIGKIVCSYISDFSQTRVGYFMCADKRIHIGDRMKYMPMGYFNSHSLGNLTSTVTTTISDVENNAPSVLITVIHGFIHVTVITIVMFFFDWRIGLLACLGIALFLLCNSVLQKKSQEVSPKRQAAQEDLVGATLEYIQGMGIVKSFNLGGKSNQKMKQAIEESRARNTKLETVFGPYGMVQLFVLRLASVAIMFCSILFYLQGSMTLVYCLLMCVASFLIFSELEAAGGKSFALRLIESSIDKVNATKGQKMLMLIGKGGEGKSRIGLVMRSLLGDSMNTTSIQKVESNRFSRADLENKLLMVDDDMDLSALPKTNYIKSIVTSECKMDMERKGVQSYQSQLYVRFLCFGNGALTALHDKSDGFFRRQIVLTTKDRPAGRADDPFLVDKLLWEKEGIFLWCLEGLHRLIGNNYQFSISGKARENMETVKRSSNNVIEFLQSEGYIRFKADSEASSKALFEAYQRWCEDNAQKPMSANRLSSELAQNERLYNVEATNNVHVGGKRVRGFMGIEVVNPLLY